MNREIIITHPNFKKGITGLAVQVVMAGSFLQGVYIGRFSKDEMDEWVFVDKEEIPKLIRELEKIKKSL